MAPGGRQTETLSSSSVKPFLLEFGYKGALLQTDFALGVGETVPLVAFAHKPIDARTACIVVIDASVGSPELVAQYRPLAAPIVLVCGRNGLEWWKQTPERPVRQMPPVPAGKLADFFSSHAADFAPVAVYRAKTWGRFSDAHQLSFVDRGLMPLVEQEIGKDLERLIVRNVRHLKSLLGWDPISDKQGQWLLKAVFWIVSAKILRDKQVAKFVTVAPDDVAALLSAVAEHFGAAQIPITSQRQRAALTEIAEGVGQFSNLHLATTESLAYVYENTLISKSTRQALGTHSTPSFLVDYIVGRLAPWIAEIPLERRNVFEPACGHSAFLVSAMRLLTELLPREKSTASQRRSYLRSRIHGIESDAFALEIARLSLSLTDIPNPDGWDLVATDMFLGDALERRARSATVFLTNPPFENFNAKENAAYGKGNVSLQHVNKTAEVLSRVLPELPIGAVMGAVVPQGFLHSRNSTDVRRYLVDNFELQEICLFPDKVFTFSDTESAVLIGRKQEGRKSYVRYRRIRERGMDAFRQDYQATLDLSLRQSRFQATCDLRVPDLEAVWNYCDKWTRLGELAEIGQGFTFKGKDLPKGTVTSSDRKFADTERGFLKFPSGICLHELPSETWLNLNDDVILAARHGITKGVPQLILNEAPTSRGPWRLKALIDTIGHPVTGRFNVVRPSDSQRTPLLFLWALCNSPVANAYAFSYSGKRHNDAGMLRKMPVPPLDDAAILAVTEAAGQYLNDVSSGEHVLRASINPDRARELLLRMDNAVLKLYDFPRELEWQLLRSFDSWSREGLPFRFDRYFPETVTEPIHLAEYLAITADWPDVNRKRADLIGKSVTETISGAERVDLDRFQSLAELRRRIEAPLPIGQLESQYRELTRGATR